MGNPYDEWENIKAFTGAQNNKTATLSDTAVVLELTTPGTWTITADVDYYVRGADAESTAVSTDDRHEFKKDYFTVKTRTASQFVSLVRCGSVSGTYWVGRIKGA